MTETFGHSNIFATLSLSLSQALANNTPYYFMRGPPASIYGFSCIRAREADLFLSPPDDCCAGMATGVKKLHTFF